MQKSGLNLAVLLAILFASCPVDVFSQGSPNYSKLLDIRGVRTQKQQTPQYEVRRANLGKGAVRQWLQIEVAFDTAPKWLDAVDFTYYALVKGASGGPKYVMFRTNITYVNVEKGSHRSEMYLHPSTLERYGNVERVAVVARINGQVAAIESDGDSRQRWWEQLSPVDGYLLNRNETPFALINFDNYPAVKASSNR